MRTLSVALVALLLLAARCETSREPAPPEPYLDGGVKTCAAMCSNLERLKCKWWSPTCIADCETQRAELEGLGVPFNMGCVAVAASCDTAGQCR